MDPEDRTVIQALPGNDKCSDCRELNPQWASVKFGTLFCLECSGKHRGLGVQTDFVRSVTLDIWTADQLAIMKAGGNTKCLQHLEKHGVEKDSTLKERYNSDAATHYKKILAAEAKGETALPPLMVTTDTGDTSSSRKDDIKALEELARWDPSLTMSEAWLPALSFLLGRLSTVINPIIFFYLLLGGMWLALSDYQTIRMILLACAGLPLLGGLFLVSMVTRAFVINRLPAFNSAHNLLLERIQNGRALRKRDAYDIFLPEKTDKIKHGIIFFPGALVNHTAYTPLASKLSDAGILVVVMSLEPTRFSADATMCKKLALIAMYEVLAMADVNVEEWVLSGHSAGASMALCLTNEMKPGISKLVMCGIGSDHIGVKTLRESSFKVLVINGTNDAFVNSHSNKEREKFHNVLPPESGGKGKTSFVTVDGGNHAGWGHYGPQVFPRKDGERTITLERQQDTFVEETVRFLSGKDK